jgi:hypothetical protein
MMMVDVRLPGQMDGWEARHARNAQPHLAIV